MSSSGRQVLWVLLLVGFLELSCLPLWILYSRFHKEAQNSVGSHRNIDLKLLSPGLTAFDQHKGDVSTIHINFIFDEKGATKVVGAIRSVLATTKHPVEFHLVCPATDKQDLVNKFGKAGPRASQLHFYDLSQCEKLFKKIGHMMGRSNPKMNICRLMLPDIIPSSIERVLYMDADVTVVRDLGSIFHTKFDENQMIGQSMDTYGKPENTGNQWPRAYEVKSPDGLKCGLLPSTFAKKYKGDMKRCKHRTKDGFERMQFNGGMGVYDLKKLRDRNFTSVIAGYVEEGYKISGKRRSYEPTQDSMNSYFRKDPLASKVLPCGANYQFRSELKAVFCAGKDLYIAHSYGGIKTTDKSPLGKRMMYFLGECEDCDGMPDVPLITPVDKELDLSYLIPVIRYTAKCPHQPRYNCTNGVQSLDGYVLDSSLH